MLAAAGGLAVLVGVTFIVLAGMAPSNDRPWITEQSRLPVTRFDGDHVLVDDVRNFDWSGSGQPGPHWEARRYDLARIETLWYILTPFARDWRGPAHAFLSFGFDDGRFLAVSVEARREVGETYSILKGLLKRFELMYVIGDERDLIGLRVLRSDDDVHVYPVRATPDAARALLVEILQEANRLAADPVFYGSFRNNCTTRILDHVNRIAPERIPYGWRVLLPGYSDALAHERDLLATELPLAAARERFRVNERAVAHIDDADFSLRIRALPAALGPVSH
jgi:hypothetical protein